MWRLEGRVGRALLVGHSVCSFAPLESCALCTHTWLLKELNNEGKEENKRGLLSIYVSTYHLLRVYHEGRGGMGVSGADAGPALVG